MRVFIYTYYRYCIISQQGQMLRTVVIWKGLENAHMQQICCTDF